VNPGELVRATVVGVAEPDEGKRRRFSESYILCANEGKLEFSNWREMVTEEGIERVTKVGVDAIFVCEWMHLILILMVLVTEVPDIGVYIGRHSGSYP